MPFSSFILFSSTISGISVIWDRRFGFLKEMLVAPVPRLAIVLGRTLGGTTTSALQALLMLLISFLLGVRLPTFGGLLVVLVAGVLSVAGGLLIARLARTRAEQRVFGSSATLATRERT